MSKAVDENKTKLRKLLKELFQFENEDLDFGIYRIMNYKKEQIEEFIDKDLVEEIGKQLNLLAEGARQALRKEVEDLKGKIREAFGDDAFKDGELKDSFKTTPLGKKYEEKRQEIGRVRVSEYQESAVYNYIHSFFSRYYHDGDFLCTRRFGKKSRYVVPYSGEETLLYWVNSDQYYVKSSEYFRKFSFKVGDLKVNFRVVEAEEEMGNVKAEEKRFFVLCQAKSWDYDKGNNELNLYLLFRSLTKDETEKFGERVRQENLNKFIAEAIAKNLADQKKFSSLFEKQEDKTVLEDKLNKYTKRNTMDYFIHRDLKTFLEQELDFFIKNEILNLEDMEKFDREKLDLYLLQAQVIKDVSMKIVDFLAQIENFQKKIWEKKKFVIRTEYVMTLNRIEKYAGKDFLDRITQDILASKGQLKEWKQMLGLDVRNEKDLEELLPLDTKHFDEDFKLKLLAALSKKNDLDAITDGFLFKSENWQALNTVLNKWKSKVKSIYIDEPYNTGSDEFLYKDSYQHSNWLSMMENRLTLARLLLRENGTIHVSIDDHELHRLRMLMDKVFGFDTEGHENFVEYVEVKSSVGAAYEYQNPFMPKNCEYLVIFARNYADRVYKPYWIKSEWDRNYSKIILNPSEKDFRRWEIGDVEEEAAKSLHKSQLSEEELYDFVLENADRIFRTISPKGAGSGLQEAMVKSKVSGWAIYERTGLDNIICYKGEMVRFYSKNLEEDSSGKKIIARELGSLWTDISWTGIAREGLVKLKAGKKPERLLSRIILMSTEPGEVVLDFFLGSGTTNAVAHKLGRKWVGVEFANYFEDLALVRMKHVLFGEQTGISREVGWKGGGIFKYQYLEQFEDSLENIEFEQKKLPAFEDYFVGYMLDFETMHSKTFLNIDELEDPFNYKIKIIKNYEPKIVNVDLVETFNYLIGIDVGKLEVLNNKGRKYVFVFGEANSRKTIVVWRRIKDMDFEDDKKVILKAIADFAPEEIYVNGDCIVKGFKQIENEIKTLLFRD